MKDTELKVCQQFHLPVMVTGPPAENHQGKYFVSNIMTYFSSVHIRDKKYHNSGMLAEDDIVLQIEISGIKSYQETKEQLEQGLEKLCHNVTGFQYDITLEKNQRSVFSIDSSNIEVLPEFADMLKQKAELFEKKKLYNLIAKMVYENKTQTEIINFVKKCIADAKGKPMPSIDVKELEDEFENLWKMYPNKKGKKNAKKFYIRSRKNGTSYEEVEAGIIAYNEENKRIGRQLIHIKHGDAWFNGECWNDEYNAQPVISSNPNWNKGIIDSTDKLLKQYKELYENSNEWSPDIDFKDTKYYQQYLEEKQRLSALKPGHLKSKPSFDIDKIAEDTLHNENYDI